jgi:desulfoferrodoxin (superoxide reductase-like protein)
MKRFVLIVTCLALLVYFHSGLAFANKSAVSIEAPATAEKDSEVVILLKVTHSGNSYFHYTKWLKVQVDGKTVAQWEYTNSNRPEEAGFTKEVKVKVAGNTEVIAETSCNIHGSASPAKATILSTGTGANP